MTGLDCWRAYPLLHLALCSRMASEKVAYRSVTKSSQKTRRFSSASSMFRPVYVDSRCKPRVKTMDVAWQR